MNSILGGFEFAIGLVVGLVLLFYVARWVRLCYYRASKLQGDALPPDIRMRLIQDALKQYAQIRAKNPTQEQATHASAELMALMDSQIRTVIQTN